MTDTAVPPTVLPSEGASVKPAKLGITDATDNFDPVFWKAVNAALDEALECDDVSRPAFVKRLNEIDPRLAQEVRKLLGRAHAQTLVTDVVRHPAAGFTSRMAPVLGGGDEQGFDSLLQRALRADRARAVNHRHAGELCGAWKLQEVIGVGGMGEVWLATRADGLFQAKAAVKFLRADGETAQFEARFAQERALLARLNHPGIAIDEPFHTGDERHQLLHELSLDLTHRLPEGPSPGDIDLQFYSQYYLPAPPNNDIVRGGWPHMIQSASYPRSLSPLRISVPQGGTGTRTEVGAGADTFDAVEPISAIESNMRILKSKIKSTMLFMMDDNIVCSLSRSLVTEEQLEKVKKRS